MVAWVLGAIALASVAGCVWLMATNQGRSLSSNLIATQAELRRLADGATYRGHRRGRDAAGDPGIPRVVGGHARTRTRAPCVREDDAWASLQRVTSAWW